MIIPVMLAAIVAPVGIQHCDDAGVLGMGSCSERLILPAPFGRRIAEPLDADAAGQATFYRCFDKIGARKASEMVILTCRTLHFSRAQSSATVVTRPEK